MPILSLLLRARFLTLTIEFFELIFYGVWLGISVLSIFFLVKCFSMDFYGFYSGVLWVDFLVFWGFWTGLVAEFSCDVCLGFLLKVVEEGDCGRHLLPVSSLIRKKKRTLGSHIEGCVVIFIQTPLLSFLFACMWWCVRICIIRVMYVWMSLFTYLILWSCHQPLVYSRCDWSPIV